MKQEIIFKKNIFGGFDRRQVIACIEKLQQESVSAAEDKNLLNLRETVEQYSNLLQEKNLIVEELKTQLAEISSSKTFTNNDSFINNISQAERNIENAKQRSEIITESLKHDISDKNEKLNVLFAKINNIKEQSEIIKDNLSKILLKLNNIEIDYSSESTTNTENQEIKESFSEPDDTTDNVLENKEPTLTEDEIDKIFQEEDNFNSIDNFFAELYKMTNGKLFEPRKLPEPDSDDDFEYEY